MKRSKTAKARAVKTPTPRIRRYVELLLPAALGNIQRSTY